MSYPYALGIDLHKRTSCWTLVDSNRSMVWSKKEVPVSRAGMEAAIATLPVPTKGLPVALEPTCGWRWVTDTLEAAGLLPHIANPYRLRLIADSTQKTDAADSRILAEFLSLGYLPESYRAPDDIERLRNLVRGRVYLVQVRASLKSRLQSLAVSRGLPPLRTRSPKALTTLAQHPDFEFHELLLLLKEYTAHISVFDKAIEQETKQNKTAQLLMTMPSIGRITALAIVAEVGSFARFPTHKHLGSFAGLVPSEHSSGETIRRGHITKTGSKLLRTMLIEAALRVKEDTAPLLYAFYLRVKNERGAMKARTALARKMLGIMWHMVKNNTPFDPSYSTAKREDLV